MSRYLVMKTRSRKRNHTKPEGEARAGIKSLSLWSHFLAVKGLNFTEISSLMYVAKLVVTDFIYGLYFILWNYL